MIKEKKAESTIMIIIQECWIQSSYRQTVSSERSTLIGNEYCNHLTSDTQSTLLSKYIFIITSSVDGSLKNYVLKRFWLMGNTYINYFVYHYNISARVIQRVA